MAWAVDQGIFEVNPLTKLRKLDEPEYEPTRPDERLLDAIFAEIDPLVRPIYDFLRETGARKSEAMKLRPDQLDYARQVVTFYTSARRGTRTKNGKVRQVPLTEDALAAVQALPRQGPTVFYNPETLEPWRERTLDKYWEKARLFAKVDTEEDKQSCISLRTHDLRHAYAITLAEEMQDALHLGSHGPLLGRVHEAPLRALFVRIGKSESFADPAGSQSLQVFWHKTGTAGIGMTMQTARSSTILRISIKDRAVDGGGIEPPASALRTRRSPS